MLLCPRTRTLNIIFKKDDQIFRKIRKIKTGFKEVKILSWLLCACIILTSYAVASHEFESQLRLWQWVQVPTSSIP